MKQILENIIKEWWSRPLPIIIPRDLDLEEYAHLKVKKIVSLVGFRRSGKTYTLLDLAKKIGKDNCVYINFEDERLSKKTEILTAMIDVLSEISGNKTYYLLLDEIQNIDNWSVWARRISESTDHSLFISGSSSKLSSAELPTELRGRSLTANLFPLNFKEFLRFKKTEIKKLPKPAILNLAREYLIFGGFPEVVLVEEGKKPLILDEYYQTFLARDVIERHNIRSDIEMKILIQLLFNSSYYTISKLANSLKSMDYKISKSTVSRHLEFLEESFLIKSLTLHTPSIKNRLKAAKKPYFIDNFFLSRYSTTFSQNVGRLMENLAAIELSRQTVIDPMVNLYYWKDYQNHEIDFVLRKKEKVEKLIQVSFISHLSEISDKETKNLIKAARQLHCQNLLYITWDLEKKVEVDGFQISFQPITQWLLE